MNKPEGLDLAGQTFAGEVTLPKNCNGERIAMKSIPEKYCVRDCSENPAGHLEEMSEELERKARPER